MKVKTKYDSKTFLVNGYFPEDVNYKNNAIDTEAKTIDGEPYIDITEEDWKATRDKTMVVIDDICQEYVKTDDDFLKEKKLEAIGRRKHYLKESSWYYEPDTYPKEIKDKRILARKEIDKIEQETKIDKIIIEFA